MKTPTPPSALPFHHRICLSRKRVPLLAAAAALALSLLFASTFVAQTATKFYPDVVMIQYYNNIPGTAVSALTSSPKFPNSPDQVVFASVPEIPVDAANEYGTRITGVLIASQ